MVPKIVEKHPKKQKGNASITVDYAGTEEITLSAKTWQGQNVYLPQLGEEWELGGGICPGVRLEEATKA